jgi:hypothetical protein
VVTKGRGRGRQGRGRAGGTSAGREARERKGSSRVARAPYTYPTAFSGRARSGTREMKCKSSPIIGGSVGEHVASTDRAAVAARHGSGRIMAQDMRGSVQPRAVASHQWTVPHSGSDRHSTPPAVSVGWAVGTVFELRIFIPACSVRNNASFHKTKNEVPTDLQACAESLKRKRKRNAAIAKGGLQGRRQIKFLGSFRLRIRLNFYLGRI